MSEPEVVFRKRTKKAATRKRAREDDEQEDDDTTVADVRKDRKKLNSFSTKRGDDSAKEKESKHVQYSASSEMLGNKGDAFAASQNEMDTEKDKDARAVWERAKKLKEDAGEASSGVYRGKNAYSTGLRQSEQYFSGGAAPKGPLRASQSIRVTCRFDYQPDICKDYKDTGYCGYGDSCKFLHDRGDYKSGWQLDKEWEEEQKKRQLRLEGHAVEEEEGFEVSDEEDELPFACFICRNNFSLECKPVVTKCKHYFCESCALERSAKTTKCAICNEQTNGIFNVAFAVIKRLTDMANANAGDNDDHQDAEEGREEEQGEEEQEEEGVRANGAGVHAEGEDGAGGGGSWSVAA